MNRVQVNTVVFVGIDPGLTGAIAAYMPATYGLTVIDVPEVDGAVDVRRLLGLWPLPLAKVAAIERVGAMPKQGVSSAFNFGHTTGILCALAHARSYDVIQVTPQQWKFGVGLKSNPEHDKKARKNASRQRAIELFPQHAQLFQRVKDDGRAEAALMAWYLAHKVHGVRVK